MATSPNYGWEEPDDTDLVKDGALSIRTMGNAIDSTLGTALNSKLHAGLVLVKTQTIGTGVSSVTVTNAFNSTYDNYLIIVSNVTSSNNSAGSFWLGNSGGTLTTSGFYGNTAYFSMTGSVWGFAGLSNSAFCEVGSFNSANKNAFQIEVLMPNLAEYTRVNCDSAGTDYNRMQRANHQVATAYPSFAIAAGSGGTLTGGTIAVYGYAKD